MRPGKGREGAAGPDPFATWRRHWVAFGAALLLSVGLPGRGSAQQVAATDVRLGPGDLVRLEVFVERAGLSPAGRSDHLVDEGGWVLLPVAGTVRVGDRPFAEVRREVEAAFAAEFAEPVVRVLPLLRVAVLGEVRLPGLIPVDPTMGLAEVLASAGGLTPSADREDVQVVGREGSRVVAVDEGDFVLDVPLMSGDRILVGRRSWLSENTSLLVGAATSVLAGVLTALIVR